MQAQILALLKDLQARLGMSLLFITHDLGIVRKMARTGLRDEGRARSSRHGTVDARSSTRRSIPIRSALLAAEPKGNPDARRRRTRR